MLGAFKYFINHPMFKKKPFLITFRLIVWQFYFKLFDKKAIVNYLGNLKIELEPMKRRGITGLIYIFRDFEDESKLMLDYIKEGMTVLDIGANIGYYSLIFSKLVGAKGHVFSFEPTKSTYEKLLRNIQLNKCNNIIPLNFALSNKKEVRKFYHADDHDRNAFAPEIKNAKFENVECEVLDDFIEKNNLNVDFIKIDVEGAEKLVFEGGKKFLSNYTGKIFCEINKYKMGLMGYQSEELVRLLKDEYKFNFYVYDSISNKLIKLSDPNSFDGNIYLTKEIL